MPTIGVEIGLKGAYQACRWSVFWCQILSILTFPSPSKPRAHIPWVCPCLSIETVFILLLSHTQIYGSLPICPVATWLRSGCKARLQSQNTKYNWQGKCFFVQIGTYVSFYNGKRRYSSRPCICNKDNEMWQVTDNTGFLGPFLLCITVTYEIFILFHCCHRVCGCIYELHKFQCGRQKL